MAGNQHTIGFSNLSEQHTFARTVRESLEWAVSEHSDLQLIVRDNDMDSERALTNAREFAEIPVDVAMIYHLDERVGPTLGGILQQKGIPIIAIDIPLSPWITYFGVNNRQSGEMVGEALGQWIQKRWDGQVDKVLVMTEPRVLDFVKQRLDYALKALSVLVEFQADDVMYLECGNERAPSTRNALPVLERWSDLHRIAVIGFNDNSALGVLDAARMLDREADVVIVGQGGNMAPVEFQHPNTRLIASTAYYPEQYGPRLVELAQRILAGERVPRENFTHHVCLTPKNVGQAR